MIVQEIMVRYLGLYRVFCANRAVADGSEKHLRKACGRTGESAFFIALYGKFATSKYGNQKLGPLPKGHCTNLLRLRL